MKELQNFVYKYMDSLKHHKRYLAMLTALSMLVTFIVPLILMEPADSMTGVLVCKKVVHTHNAECYVGNTLVCNIEEHIHTGECYKKVSLLSLKGESSSGTSNKDNIPVPNAGGGLVDGSYTSANAHLVVGKTDEYYNPATLPLYTLLFGELDEDAVNEGKTHWVNPEQSLEDNLELVDDEYFLGFASDFCAFIESDFTAFDADAEGRVFIGGDLIFKGIPDGNKWNYQVGAGDYGQFTPILQTDEYGHLTGFASGIIGGKVYRLGTMTTGAYASLGGNQNKLLPEDRDPRHTDGNDVFLYPEEGAYKRFIVGNLKDSLHYDEDGAVADIPYSLSCNHLYANVNCSICGSDSDHSYLGEVNELSQFYIYDDVRTILEKTFDTLRARSLSLASIEAREAVPNGGTLTLDATNIGDAKTVYFKVENWDNITKVDIKVPENRIKKIEESPYTNNQKTITELDLNIIVSCDDEEIDIYGTQTLVNDFQISKSGENSTNNHPLSSNILYNFYNATSVTFNGGCNFNGTVLAPNANATSPEKCPGHLSGALIAKSFYGGLEFGYRPYRGGVDIFGMTSGYAVPVNKVDQDGATLPGALFAIKEGGKFVSLFESGSGTSFAALPSRVDFTGGTYRQEIVGQESNVDRYYAGNEVPGGKLTAPVDFTLYKDLSYSESIASGTTLNNVLTKFYLKANQKVDFDYNENIHIEGPPTECSDGDFVYTVYLVKPVNNIDITARNQGDNTNYASATVNFTPMTLTLTDENNGTPKFEVGTKVKLNAGNLPTGDTITIWYKYFVNGNAISDYVTDTSCDYTPSAAGDLLFSVEAYVNINGQYYNIARATDEEYIKAYEFTDNMAIKLYTYDSNNNIISLTNNTITSGGKLIIDVENVPEDSTIEYSFNGVSKTVDNGNVEFETNDIVGNFTVKAIVSKSSAKVELYSTVTVDFPEMTLTFGNCSYDNENNKWFYVVNSDTNDKLNFSVSGIPNGATVKYYFKDTELETNNNSASKTKTVIGEDIPVHAVVSLNGIEKTLEGYVTGKYNDGLKLTVQQQAGYIVGNEIKLYVTNAPNGANVVFNVYDSYGNFVKTLGTDTVENGEAWASYTPEKSGSYYFKASMTYGDNPVKELTSDTITVVPVTLNGELSVTPSQVNTGSEVEFKVYGATGATIGADVTFTVKDQNGNIVHTISGLKVNDNGECTGTYKPTQAGSYTVEAAISKGDTPRNLQKSFTAIENTSALSGTFTLSKETITPGSDIDIVVSSPNNGAVVNIKITNPNGKTYTQSANINNGAYSFTFNPANLDNVAGVYTVSVELVQDTSSQSLGEQKFTVSNGNDVSGDISVSSEAVTPYDPINVNITNAPVGASVSFKFYYYGNLFDSSKSATVGADGSCSVTFEPAIVGNYQVEAIINYNGSVKTVETSFKSNATFELDKSEYVAGEQCIIKVSEIHDAGNNTQTFNVQEFTINGQTVSPYTVNGNTITFNTSEQYYGTYNLYLRIQLSGGAVTEFSTEIINNAPTSSAAYTLRNTSNLKNASFLKNVNILSDEGTESDNLIEITPEEDGERISSVRLTFPDSANAKNNSFKLAVTFTDTNGKSYTKEYTKDNVAGENPAYLDILTSEIPGDADIDEENITKISITSVAGSIAVDKCYPTYVKAENQIIKTYTKGFTLNPNEQKEIVIENWLETLDSITFNIEGDGEIFYALIGADETATPVFNSAQSKDIDGNKIIEITGINDNIKKIKIYTKQESPLTVKDYTIIGFTGDTSYDNNAAELKNNEWDVINYYTLVEQQAPVGYFKEETVYTIEVKETIDLASLSVDGKPTKVLTTISVKDKNGIVVLSYSVNTEYEGDNKKITILDNDPESTDVSFTLTENNGVVTVKDSAGNDLGWDTSKPKSHIYNEKEYYLDPAAMMIVPVPESIEYTNRKALLFRKVDDGGAIVKEVMIQMHEYVEVEENGETKWKWQAVPEWKWSKNETSECLLSIDGDTATIKTGTYYKFHESDAGGKYELTDDIYMIRDSDKTNEIHYWTVDRDTAEAPTKPDEYNVLDLTSDNVIRMSNYKIPGVKLSLSKTDLANNVITGATQDAVFNLYANDGTLLQKDITVTNGHIELNLLSVTDTEGLYVEEGYLKPGTYFLREMKAPTNYEASVSDFYFSVLVDQNGVYSVKGEESTPGVVRLTETQSDGTVHRVVKFQQKALEQLAELDPYTPVIQFKFNTSGGEMGYGNAKFSAIVDGKTASPEPSAYPSGCNEHTNGISFQSAEVMVQLSIEQLCALFGVSDISSITEFSINCWNSTTISDVDFYPLENPIPETLYTNSGTQFNLTSAGFRKITDDMIKNETDILSISFKASDTNGNTGKYKGTYGSGENSQKENAIIKCSESPMTITLTAKEMLTNLGITLSDSITGDELVTEFRKLSAFGIDTWNGTEITDVTFNVPADDNTDDTTTELSIPSITVNGTNVKISNDEIKNVMKLRVEKKWQGDNGVTELRQPVTVTLKRKVGETGSYAPYNPSDEVSGEQELSSENSWTYTWENLPRSENTDGSGAKYYYTVEETPITGYNSSLGIGYENFNESGTITLTNTANVIDIPVSKSWDYTGYDASVVPDSVMFKLQAKLGEDWIDLPQKTIVLTKPDNWDGTTAWEGKFENLPVGYEYQAVECKLPYDHWTVTQNNSVTAAKADKEEVMASGFEVKNTYNPPEGGLEVKKDWIGDTAADRPEQLKLNVYRTIAKPYYEETDAPYVEEGNDYKSDYARLLQHSLYFYDANMCGDDVSANSVLAWRSNCHLEDEVQGGYHDAGDHVMFGLPQGYTATMLSWAYLEFFKEDGDATKAIDSADKAHLELILKRFYDFFVDSVKYEDGDTTKEISEILVQKGHGNVDHLLWCSPETQKSRESEMIWSSTSGANIAAEYAAALALGHIIFGGEGNDYLEVAEKLYRYAGKTSAFQAGDSEGSYYSDGDKEDDMQLAAAWLYEATGKGGDTNQYYSGRYKVDSNINEGLQWDNVHLAAAMATARQEENWTKVKEFIGNTYTNSDSFYYIHEWGTARFNAMAQTAILIAAKYNPNERQDYVNWATGQMNKILGDNNWKDTISEDGCTGGTVDRTGLPVCLVTNFAPDEIYSPQAAHHRAASGWETHEDYKNNCGYSTENSHQLIGALAGGPAFKAHTDQAQMNGYQHDHPRTTHNYIDDLHDYCCNEVAIDYNAGLVGAAAGLFYFTGTGERSTMIEGVEIKTMGGTPEYTVAYSPSSLVSSNAYTLERVSIQSGYNMVPLRRTAVSVLNGTASILETDTSNNKQYFEAQNNVNTSEYASALSGNYKVIGYTYLCSSCTSNNNIILQNSVDNSQITIYINTFKEIEGFSIPSGGVQFGWWGGSNACNHLYDDSVTKEMRVYVEPVSTDPEIDGASEMYEGETEAYTLDGASNWTVSNLDSSEEVYASIDESGNLSSIANVEIDTKVQISVQLNGETIPKDVTIKPISITAQNNITDITVGDTQTYTLQLPDGCSGFTFRSSNEDAVKIDWTGDGRQCAIQAQNAGEATIEAYKTIDGEDVVFAEYDITVNPPELQFINNTPSDWVVFNVMQEFTFETNASATWEVKLGNTVINSDSTDIQYTVNDDRTICTVKFLKIIEDAINNGVTITATSTDGTNKSISRTVKLNPISVAFSADSVATGVTVTLSVDNSNGLTCEYYLVDSNGNNETKLDSNSFMSTEGGEYYIKAKVLNSNGEVIGETAAKKLTVTATDPDGITFTNGPTDGAAYKVREAISITADASATWSSNKGSDIVEISPSNDGKSCTVKILKYTADDIVITATKSGDNSKTASVTIKAEKLTLTIDPSEVTVNNAVTFKMNYIPDGAEIQYFDQNNNKITSSNQNNVSYTPTNSGTYTITANAFYNGNEIAASDAATLNVKNASVASFEIACNNSTINLGGNAYIQNYNGVSGFTLSVVGGDPDCVIIDGQNVYGVKPGKVTVKATKDGVDSNNTIEITINPMTINNTYRKSIGESQGLSANDIQNRPSDDVTWSIVENDNYDNAIINNNNIVALKPGTAQVKATIQFTININNTNYSRTAEVVTDFTINQVEFNGISDSMIVGESIELDNNKVKSIGQYSQENLNNAQVSWSILPSDTTVAKLNGNKIEALSKGEFTLVATITPNNYSDTKYQTTLTQTITVSNRPMSLTPNTAEIEVKGEIKLQPSNVPEGYTITWDSSNPDIAKVDENGNVIGVKASDDAVTITATATCEGEDDITATAQITVIPISVPEGYYLINSITPEDNKIVKDKNMDIGDMHAIVSDHPVDAILIEFEPVNDAFNGYVYWNKTWDNNSIGSDTSQFIYDQWRDDTNIVDNKYLITYDNSLNLTSLGIMGTWGEGAGVIKSIKFLTENLKPTILNAPTQMTVGEEVTLDTVGFTNTENIQWTVSGGTATIENGVFKPLTQGTYTITATNGSETATTTIEVARTPIKIGFNDALDEVTKTVKYTEDVTLYSSEDVTYEIVQNARIDVSSLITIDNNVVKVADESTFGTANVTVTIQGYVPEGGEKVVSNQVQVTFVGQIYITGISELAPNKSTTLKAENALGEVTWGVAEDDSYTIETNNVDDSTQYVVKDKTSQKIILTLNASNGKITAGEASGTVNIQATADGETADYTVVVKDLPMKPIIPTEGKELVKEIILTGESWSANLENLPVEDEKGNIYYYYIEEYAYKKSASDEDWTLIYTPESLGFIHANGSYMPVSYTGNGNSLNPYDPENPGLTNLFTVGNKATEKPQGQLPSTGGSGVTTYYYFGGALMLLGIAGFTSLKRRERKRRKE